MLGTGERLAELPRQNRTLGHHPIIGRPFPNWRVVDVVAGASRRLVLFICAVWLAGVFGAQAGLVYNNSSSYSGSFFPSTQEFGDQVFPVYGTNTLITEIQLEYFGNLTPAPGKTGRVRLYANDGVNGAPGTLLFVGSAFTLRAGYNSIRVFNFETPAPSDGSVTWTVQFSGLDGSEQAGLDIYETPTLGLSPNDFWRKDQSGGWNLNQFPGATPKANFGAKIIAVNPGFLLFTDANLAAAVRQQLSIGANAAITTNQLFGMASLSAASKGITDLTGLELAIGLTSLNLSGNPLTSLDPIGSLPSLISLDLSTTTLTNFAALAGVSNLQTLVLTSNPIGTNGLASLSGLTNLNSLSLGACGVSNFLALTNLSQLRSLDVSGNSLRQVGTLGLLTSLQSLNVNSNALGLGDLSPLSGLTNLTVLSLQSNQLTSLSSLGGMSRLTQLFAANNQITNLTPLSTLTGLAFADLSNNRLTSIVELVQLPNLTGVNISGNFLDLTAGSPAALVVQSLVGRGVAVTNTSQTPLLVPVVTSQPQSQALSAGGNGTFSVAATGTAPLSYQWRFNGVDLLGATNTSLTLTGVQITNIGAYQAVVSNFGGAVTSQVADLSLSVTIADQVLDGLVRAQIGKPSGGLTTSDMLGLSNVLANFSGLASLSGLESAFHLNQLRLNGDLVVNVAPISGLTNLQFLDLTSDPVTNLNALAGLNGLLTLQLGSSTINNATLTAISGLTNLTSLSVQNSPLSDLTPLGKLTRLTQLFLFNDAFVSVGPLSGLTNLTLLDIRGDPVVDLSPLRTLVALQTLEMGGGAVSNAALAGLPGLTNLTSLLIQNSPITDISALARLPNLTQVSLVGNQLMNVAPLIGLPKLSFVDLSNNRLTNINALVGLTGVSSLNLSGNFLDVSAGSAALGVIQTLVNAGVGVSYLPQNALAAPSISVQAQGTTVAAGDSFVLSVTAAGSSPLNYQWQLNGVNVPGATNASLSVNKAQGANAGNYQVVVTNWLGAVTSAVAVVTVNVPAGIVSQPFSLSAATGMNVSFSVGVVGSPPLTFQWQFNGANIAGATNATLTLPNVQLASVGSYQVSVSNLFGSATSQKVTLTLVPNQLITFTDPNLAFVVSSLVGKPGISVTTADVLSMSSLVADSRGIQGLVGLEALTSLTNLVLSGNQITNLAPIAGLTNLTLLDVSGDPVTSLASLAGLKRLQVLGLNGIPLGGSALTVVGGLTALTFLSAQNCQLSDLTPITNLTSLTQLGLGDNLITNVAGLANMTELVSLDLSDNRLIRIAALTNLTSLTNLDVRGNYLDLTPGSEASAVIQILSNRGVAVEATAQNVPFPPVITLAPSDQTGAAGAALGMSVAATGTQPISYQWQFNSAALPGATNALLLFTNLTTANAGSYRVVVTNWVGSVTTAPITLTINVPITLTTSPQSQAVRVGSSVTFNVAATGTTPITYQWLFNGVGISGATNTSLTLQNVGAGDQGVYQAQVSNPAGGSLTKGALLTVNFPLAITSQPTNQTVTAGTNVTFNVAANGTTPISYQWQFNGANLFEATNSSLTLSNVVAANAGNYAVTLQNVLGSLVSTTAALVVNVPVKITSQPQNRVVPVGAIASFSVTATGTAHLSYQWELNGVNLVGATNSSLTITNAQPTDAGVYQVVVSNLVSTVVSTNASLTVNVPPTITFSPTNQSVVMGTNVTFGVTVDGSAPFSFQWQFNGRSLAGATNSSLTLSNVVVANAGSYAVIVQNAAGSVSSLAAALVVNVPVSITAQPQSQNAVTGSNAVFAVTATGTAPLGYQWLVNGVALPGATNSSLTISNVQLTDAGVYQVVVTNVVSTVTSTNANLTVNSLPLITTAPASQSAVAGTNVSFFIIALGTPPLTFQWQFNGNNIVGATNFTLSLTNVSAANIGSYSAVVRNPAGSVPSAPATLTINFPVNIVTQPKSQTVVAGTNITFIVTANGTGPLGYQWLLNGAVLPGATNAALALTNVQQTIAGAYQVVVSNVVGAVTSTNANLIVNSPPSITLAPQSQAVPLGSNVTFTVVADGTAPLTYQWQSNNVVVAGATNVSLTLSNLLATSGGNYTVTVKNAFGSVTTPSAVLSVISPVSLTSQPKDLTVVAGKSASFAVTAAGSAPISYQWWFGGQALAGATNASLAIGAAQATNAGVYFVVVTNLASSVTSSNAALTINSPPSIILPPQPLTVVAGSNAAFSVTAGGLAPLSYQWSFNGAGISGATNAALFLSGVQPTNAGNYAVTVTNSLGSVTSDPAALIVNVPPTITAAPQNLAAPLGGSATFTVAVGGTAPFAYQWQFGQVTLGGATNSSLTLSNLNLGNAGAYRVIVTNVAGVVTSDGATLVVVQPPVIVQSPQSRAVTVGDNATFAVSATGEPLNYQWELNGKDLSRATNATLTITNAQPGDAGKYSVVVRNVAGTVTSDEAVLTVNPVVGPAIVSQPQDQTVGAGSRVSFSVGATGSAPLIYQWQINGTNIVGATNAAFIAPSVQFSDAGVYSVVVRNAGGAVTSGGATLVVLAPPVITRAPAPVTVVAGLTARLSVVASGMEPLQYQWRFGGTSLSGATNSTLTLVNVQAAQAGAYFVVVTNFVGAVTSAAVALTVDSPISIDTQPAGLTVSQGSPATFNVTASGTPPLAYQWLLNGTVLPSATNRVLSIPAAQLSDAGQYSVLVSNIVGSAVSTTARLTVNLAPAISRQPRDASAVGGANAGFSVVASGSEPLSYQWRLNGAVVSGGSGPLLSLTNVTAAVAGAYTVIVTNVAGAVTSSIANLTIASPVVITTPPQSQNIIAGGSVNLSVSATGSAPLGYQWRYYGVNLSGATNRTLTLTNLPLASSGPYSVVVTNAVSALISAPAELTVNLPPTITVQPQSRTNALGDAITFSITAKGTFPLGYQWWFNQSNLVSGATNAILNLTSVRSDQVGAYTVVVTNAGGSVTSSPATLTLSSPPIIQTEPQSFVAALGGNASFAVGAVGAAPLTYQWRLEGANLPGQTNHSMTVSNVQPANLGDYTVLIVNRVGNATSAAATLALNLPSLALTNIFAQSVSTSATNGVFDGGSNATASKEAGEPNHAGKSGGHSLWFDWLAPANGVMTVATVGSSFDTVLAVYTGATVAGLTTVASDDDDGGVLTSRVEFNAASGTFYHVAIDGASSTATGRVVVTLSFTATAQTAPRILANPVDLTVTNGATATFSVTAQGAGLSYQWLYNGANLAGATSSNFVLNAVQPTNAGPYSVRVSNGAFTVLSTTATLEINSGESGGVATFNKFSDFFNFHSPSGLALSGLPARSPLQPMDGSAGAASGYSGVQIFTTFQGTIEPGEPNPWPVPGGAPVWFLYQARTNGVLQLSTTGSDFPTLLAVFTGPGTDFASLHLEGADTHSGTDGKASLVTVSAVAGTNYFVVVDGDSGARGHAQLSYTLAQPPVIVSPPVGQTGSVGAAISLSVIATNALASVPLFYQWRHDGVEIANATNSTLALSNLQLGAAGAYVVVITNFAGRAASSPALVAVNVPLTITASPASQSAAPGSTVIFNVAASGTGPLTYQWLLNGVNIVGATNASYTLTNAQIADAGGYSVTITNPAGVVTSPAALLSVAGPPTGDE